MYRDFGVPWSPCRVHDRYDLEDGHYAKLLKKRYGEDIENEVLLPRNQKFMVTGFDESKNLIKVKLI